jgi:hypothetical protein
VKQELNKANREAFRDLKFRLGEFLWALLLLVVMLVFIACQKPERNNPFDEENTQNPQEWSPQNLQISTLTPVIRKLSWDYGTHHIEGFKIDRKKGEEPWQETYAILSKETREWTDDLVVPDPALVYQYRVFAFAGDNISTKTEITGSAAIPAPGNLKISSNNITSVTLSWEDNCPGAEGFRIERRDAGGNWAEIAKVPVTSYHDNSFDLNTQVYYRIRAYYGQYQSDFAEKVFYAQMPSPVNLQITTHSATSITLNWNFAQTGHDGFRIDRKAGNENWVNGFASVSPGHTAYQDNTLDLASLDYTYRVYAYSRAFESSKVELIATPTIGIFARGGIVFYVNGSGGGLVCAESDQGTDIQWGCKGSVIGGTGIELGEGLYNTASIASICTEVEIAARICSDLVENGYSDWFLPSRDEQELMYKNLNSTGLGVLANAWYWSSSEFDSNNAWSMNFTNGYQISNSSKNNGLRVRAVRAF